MQCSILLLCTFCFLLGATWGNQDPGPELLVSTTLGTLSGSHLASRSGRTFAAFRGVPYAKPPVADLRFKDPVPAEEWAGVFDATREGPICNQFNYFTKKLEGTEDCLKLNVYTHNVNTNQLKPVMLWIHGGGFYMGDGNGETGLYGPENFMDKDIVFVTINYRLGPFGFLTTGDAEAPGNYGLMDQTLALKWVQQHIRSFGGDPDSVTIFGESAGGASVEFQVLSPHSKGLFHRAISQSGSATAYWALHDSGKEHARTLAEYLSCPTESSSEMLACLKAKDANDLTSAMQIMEDGYKPLVRFMPRIDIERDSPFVPAHPHQLIKSKSFNHVPYITGMNQNEGAMMIPLFTAENGALMDIFEKDPVTFMLYHLSMEKFENGRQIVEKILELFDKEKPFAQQLETIEQVFSDASFFKSIDQAANLYAKFNEEPTYYYHYAHQGSVSLTGLFGLSSEIGVAHGDELFLMFKSAMTVNSTAADVEMSKLLIDLWTSFAIHGAPESDLDFKWLPTDKTERRILNIDANPFMTEKLPFIDRLPFWYQLLDIVGEKEREVEVERHTNKNEKAREEL